MEQNPNPAEEEAPTRKLHEILAEMDKEECEEFSFQEEMVEEVMQELYKEIALSTNYVPVNPPILMDYMNNRSCGTLISSSTSTMMAEIEGKKEVSSETLFEFDDTEHLDCEWVGRVFRKWWF
ncbi:hypothetical protein Fmac_031791 [Flemingia macrophylla]|uniref:Uncharacterized protein n=1 Tax=Flemingia macrophylla TaxID=520843 RepID=A0ABD1L4D8_9FABA